MFDRLMFAVIFLAALGSGLAGGGFLVFSTFIMKAVARLPAAEGIRAMQAINVAAINPVFMAVVFGTVVAGAVAAARDRGFWTVLGCAVYVAGVVLVTVVANVPRNNALAALDPAAHDAATAWARFLRGWTAWNHVRTVCGLLASAAFTLALVKGGR